MLRQDTIGASRSLGRSEYAFWMLDQSNSTNHVSIAEVNGGLEQSALQYGLEHAQRRHPLLCSRIAVHQKHDVRFEPVQEPASIDICIRPMATWRNDVARELDTPFVPGSYPLMRCLWFRDQTEESVIAIVLHHAIADAIAGTSLLLEIMRVATDSISDSTPVLPKRSLPCIESLHPKSMHGFARLEHLLRFLGALLSNSLRRRDSRALPHFRPTMFQPRQFQIHPIEFDCSTSTALLAACRAERTTIQGALGAAMLLALNSEFPSKKAVFRPFVTPVNLRTHLTQTVAPDDMGTYVGNLLTNHRATPGTPFWDIAREFSEQLRFRVQRGDAHAQWLVMPSQKVVPPTRFGIALYNRLLFLKQPAIMITNIGKLPDIQLQNTTQIRSLSFAMSPIIRDPLALCVSSWQKRLKINAVFSQIACRQEQITRILERFQEHLLTEAQRR